MAHVENPRKQFQFTIIIPGMNPFLAQTVKMADVELDSVEHGDTGFSVKTAGMKKIGKLTVDKISPAEAPDVYFRNWQKTIMNTNIGGGLLPSLYKKGLMIEEYSADGITVINRTFYRGAWPQKVNGHELNRKGSDNTIESIEFEVDEEF